MGSFGQSFAAGVQAVQNPQAAEKDRQQQLQMKVAPLSQALQADQTRLALYADASDPTKPQAGKEKEYNETLQRMTSTIAQMRSLLGDNSPHSGLLDHLHIRHDLASRVSKYNNQTGQMAQEYAAGAMPFEQTPEGQKLAYQRATAVEAARARNTPSLKLYKLPDGTTGYFDAKNPDAIPEGATPVSLSTTTPHIKQVKGKDGKPQTAIEHGGKFYDQDGNEIPNAELYQKPAQMQPKAGVSNGHNVFAVLTDKGWVDAGTKQPLRDFHPAPSFAQMGLYEPTTTQDDSGNFVTGIFDRRSGKTIVIKSSGPIDPKIMGEVNKSLEPARDADTRYRVMADNETAALAGDQQAMLSLVANHIGMTLGQQKGSRINQAVWNEAVQSAPWLSRAGAKFDDRGLLSGVVLAPEQIEQMVDLAKQRRVRQWQQAQEAGQQYGVEVNIPDDLENPSLEGPRAKKLKNVKAKVKSGGWSAPADAPPAPKEDGKALKADGKVIAISKGGEWVQP